MFSRSIAKSLRSSLVISGITGALLATAIIAPAAAEDTLDASSIRTATKPYHDVSMAEDAGYARLIDTAGISCIDDPDAGAMGIHYANGDLVASGVVDPLKPQVLVYEPGPDDNLSLTAVEYVVFQEGWDATHDAPPALFGQEFMLTSEQNRYGLPAFYSLHDWVWKTNPGGEFAMWNPDVSCPQSSQSN